MNCANKSEGTSVSVKEIERGANFSSLKAANIYV